MSDTYKGSAKNRDAQVLRMVEKLSRHSVLPTGDLQQRCEATGASGRGVSLCGQTKANRRILNARSIDFSILAYHSLRDNCTTNWTQTTGSYLWTFLEEKWAQLNTPSPLGADVLERMVRRRAAIQIGDIDPSSGAAAVLAAACAGVLRLSAV